MIILIFTDLELSHSSQIDKFTYNFCHHFLTFLKDRMKFAIGKLLLLFLISERADCMQLVNY